MKLDLSNKSLKKLDYLFLKQFLKSISLTNELLDESVDEAIQTVILDNNFLSKLENLECFPNLKNLSLANNRLVEIKSISKLVNLQYVNLLNNSLTSLECFRDLKNLTWLNLSGNQIKSLESLKFNTNLQYLDASDNSISCLSDLRTLKDLNTLNLNGNEINSLKSLPNCIPSTLKSLFLSYNAIEDLNEVCYLACLTELENLCIDNNPCVAYSNGFNYENLLNYRPYVINWCLSLKLLDGCVITQNEYLKAEWLYSQGKGRHYKPGQNTLLIEYLIKNCPINSSQSFEENSRFSKILEKKEIYSHDISETNNKSIIDSNTYSKMTSASASNIQETENEHSKLNNFFSSSNDSVNNIAKSPVKSKLSFLNVKTDTEHTDSDREKLTPNNKYYEYENRPIKPLDQNAFYKQISEYSEVSGEELEQMKKRVDIIRTRSKTTDPSNVSRLPQQRAISAKAPSRKLSLNQPSQLKSTPTPRVNRLKQKSKTQDESISTKSPQKPINTSQPRNTKYSRSSNNTPVKTKTVKQVFETNSAKTVNSPIRRAQLNRRSSFTITPSKSLNKKPEIFKESQEENSTSPKQDEVSKISTDIHTKIQKQRQEMRLQREKNLREFKNQLKILDQQKELNELESFYNKIIEIPKNLTFEDKCATKIQATFRGYLLRKSRFFKPKLMYLKYKRLLRSVQFVRENLNQLKKDQLDLIELNQDSVSKLLSMIQSFSNLNLNHQIEPVNNFENTVKNLKSENEELKQKLRILEEKCKKLESQEIELFPPLKVRLQKLNEKSVALKWNHNPKNESYDISGYNIYINDELCGTMKSSDTVASINGIQEEGEYRIYIRTFMSKLESENSNCVVTRVKKKQPFANSTNNTTTSTTNQKSEDLSTDTEDKTQSEQSSDIGSKLFKFALNKILPLGAESSTEDVRSNENVKPPFTEGIETSGSFSVNASKNSKVLGKPPISPTNTPPQTLIKQNSKSNIKQAPIVLNESLNAKYSTSEPNLLAKTQLSSTSSSTNSTMARYQLVRQSISLEDDNDDFENSDCEELKEIGEYKSLDMSDYKKKIY